MRIRIALGAVLLIASVGCSAPGTVSASPSAPTSDSPGRTSAPSATSTPPAPTTAAATLLMPDVCGMLTRYASDGNLRNLDVATAGTATRYRLFGPGTAPSDVGAANQNSVLIRLTGRRVTPDSGQPDAINVTDFAVTYVASCAPSPAPYAIACGTVSDYANNGLFSYGSYVLNSPGRAPIKVALTSAHSTPTEQSGGSFGGYVCAQMDPGSPLPVHGGLAAPGAGFGYVTQGTYPATLASPAPTGFVVPQACAYVSPPEVGADQTTWKVECGAEADRNARGTLGPALTQQGWLSCGPALATAAWIKAGVRLVVVESSLAPGDYPRFAQAARPANACS